MVQVFRRQHIDKIVHLNQLFSLTVSHKTVVLLKKKERKVTAKGRDDFIFFRCVKTYFKERSALYRYM